MKPGEISDIRARSGLTQVDFARLFNRHFMTVSKWERGISHPNNFETALLYAFKKAFETDAESVRDELALILCSDGVISGLYFLLRESRRSLKRCIKSNRSELLL